MAGLAENQGARVFHLMMIVPAGLLLLLLSLISLGTMATTNKKFTDELDDLEPNNDGTCILFAEPDDDPDRFLEFPDGNQCKFVIAGGAILAVLAVAFTVVLIVKAVFGVGVLSFFALIELVMSAVGSVWAFIVSVVITAGLNDTCDAFAEAVEGGEDSPCCAFYYGRSRTSSSRVYFYEGINTSRITAWFAMALLIAMTGIYTCILIIYCCTGRGRTRGSDFTDKPTSDLTDDPKPI